MPRAVQALRRWISENHRMHGSQTRRTHVVTLTDTIGVGGAEQIVLTLNQSLDPERFRRTVCITRDPAFSDPDEEFDSQKRVALLRQGGIEVLVLRRRSSRDLLAWMRLIRFIRAERVDILHAHKFGSNVWGALIGKLARVPVMFAHEHTWSFEGEPLRRFIDRRVVGRLADAVIAVSRADERRLAEVVGIPSEKIVLVPNGIAPLPAGDGAAVRREAGVSAGATVLVAVANLRPQKAIDVMIRALALLLAGFPDVRLLIAGGGERSALEDLAAELGVAQAVVFLGARNDVADVLAAADVAVSSSDFEGSPLAGMEYLAAGLPVVATDVGGMPDLVRDGENGLLVPRQDPEAMAAAIAQLLADPQRARAMGERGRGLQEREFSLDAMVRRVEALYTERLARKRAARRASASSVRSPTF
jgi:glycosyltransferase involved in cell wall biosynthesis